MLLFCSSAFVACTLQIQNILLLSVYDTLRTNNVHRIARNELVLYIYIYMWLLSLFIVSKMTKRNISALNVL